MAASASRRNPRPHGAARTTHCSQYGLKGLKAMGGFRNVRQEFDWQGLVLELDQTKFAHGTVYELEAETVCMGRFFLPVCACVWMGEDH